MSGWGSKESDIYAAISVILMLLSVLGVGAWIFFKGFINVPVIASASPYAALVIFLAGICFLIYTLNLRAKGK